MKTFTLNAAGGIDNIKDHIYRNAGKVIPFLKEGRNIDIDDEGFWRLRPGRSAAKYSGSGIHSGDKKGSGLFMEGSVLKQLKADYTTMIIATMNSDGAMVYENIPGIGIAISNGTDIGIVKNYNYTAFTNPLTQYKRAIPAGQILAWYNGVLYVASGSDVYYSDAFNYGIMDTRNKKKRLKSYVTMIQSVDDGMYVSDSDNTFFWSGTTPHNFSVKVMADYPAIYGMSDKVEKQLVGDGSIGITAFWMSKKGMCSGTASGQFTNLTLKKYSITSVPQKGTAFFRYNNGIPQFIAVGQI
jgi:hypothetical protein